MNEFFRIFNKWFEELSLGLTITTENNGSEDCYLTITNEQGEIIVEEYDVEFSDVLFAKALISLVNWLEENYDGY